MSWFSYLADHPDRVLALSGQHALLSVEGTVLGAVVAIPLGLWLHDKGSSRRIAASATELIQTIPSLAMLAVLLIWLGMGNTTLVAALFLYALMPMLHNTIEGLRSVDPVLLDVARGTGMSHSQIVGRVQIRLAMPIILTGFRVALVTSIGIATMGVFIGAGGLGRLIYGGMQILSPGEIFAGSAPAAAMAILIDAILAALASQVGKRRRTASPVAAS